MVWREGIARDIRASTADGRHFLPRVHCDNATFLHSVFLIFSQVRVLYFLFPLSLFFPSQEKKTHNKNRLWKIKRRIFFPCLTFNSSYSAVKQKEIGWCHVTTALLLRTRCSDTGLRGTYKTVCSIFYNTQFQLWIFIIPIGIKIGMLMFGSVRCLVNSGWCTPKRYWSRVDETIGSRLSEWFIKSLIELFGNGFLLLLDNWSN